MKSPLQAYLPTLLPSPQESPRLRMRPVTTSTEHIERPFSTPADLRLGVFLGILSAVAYTAANIFLRHVAIDCEPAWVSFNKAIPATVVGWVLVLLGMSQGRRMMPPRELLRTLIGLSIFVQIAGNIAFQWSLAQVGLALAVPLGFGMIIVSGALLGRIWLSEPITVRSAISILVLIAAVGILSVGAAPDQKAVLSDSVAKPAIVLGVIAACSAGFAYAVNTTYIRAMALGAMPVATTLMVISTVGVVVHGLITSVQIGWAGVTATTAEQWGAMYGAGTCNAVAFFSLGYALQRISVLHVNILNASQVAMAAVAGVMIFGEQPSTAMYVGCGLTALGMILIQARTKDSALERLEKADGDALHAQIEPARPVARVSNAVASAE